MALLHPQPSWRGRGPSLEAARVAVTLRGKTRLGQGRGNHAEAPQHAPPSVVEARAGAAQPEGDGALPPVWALRLWNKTEDSAGPNQGTKHGTLLPCNQASK